MEENKTVETTTAGAKKSAFTMNQQKMSPEENMQEFMSVIDGGSILSRINIVLVMMVIMAVIELVLVCIVCTGGFKTSDVMDVYQSAMNLFSTVA